MTTLIKAAPIKPLELRPTTNLVSKHVLNQGDNRRGFLFFYNVLYGYPAPIFMARLFFGEVAPQIVHHKKFGNDKRTLRGLFDATHGPVALKVAKGYLSIKKIVDVEEPFYEVKIPVFRFSDGDTDQQVKALLAAYFKAGDITEELADELRSLDISKSIDPINFEKAKANLRSKGSMDIALEDCFLGADIEPVAGGYVAYVKLALESYEAEQLTSTPFEQIRPNDLYAIILNWAVGYYGTFHKPPKTSFPIGKIAATLPVSKHIKPRVNAESITLTATGRPLLIPREVNDIQSYDQAYLNAGHRGDNTFQLLNPSDSPEEIAKRRLPANVPVFVDWVNAKFTYSDTNGHLKVFDLAQCREPNATHLVRLAGVAVEEKVLDSLANLGHFLNAKPFQVLPADVADLGSLGNALMNKNVSQFFSAMSELFPQLTGRPTIRWRDLNGSEVPALGAIGRFLKGVGAVALGNIDAVYNKYSVMFACQNLPWLIIAGVYCAPERLADLQSKDATLRKVYQDQAPDPKWGDEALPLTGESLGQLPHQKRIRNQMRNFPPNAILSVPAGGGKTPLLIMDILKFIKAGRAFPYLIMCPSHLVAQYVSEFAFFTGGKMNVIPINTSVISSNSLERITSMIQQMPRNTVVVVDYDVTSRIAADDILYGTAQTTVYHIIEFLRQFQFQYVGLDEAHYLRRDSGRTEAVQSLILDVPYKRLASGTFAHDSMSDLATQMGILDPTMFGSREDFNAMYGLEVKGGRVTVWKPGAEQMVNSMLKQNMVLARAHRKEWAALLPPFQENLHIVNMSENQKRAYDSLLGSVTEELKEKAKTNPLLRKWLLNQAGETGEDVAEDEIQAESLEQLLKTYLARLERFLTAMGRDDWGKANLQGDDLKSPKILKIIELIESHINQNIPGKIIIFTNYVWSAEEIYAALPPHIKKRFLHYQASNKTELLARFEKDDILGMVGVSASMDTGLNLQSASRLIREGLVWNPGTLEQGDARIGRPQLKHADDRSFIYYDTVLVNDSLDITKLSRIYSKLLSVEKYNNAGNPLYMELPDLPVISMNMDSIFTVNSVHQPEVLEYIGGYKKYKAIRDGEYQEYREKYFGENRLVLQPVPKSEDPKDAATMAQIPYTPGGTLFGMDLLGLKRLDQYLTDNVPAGEDDADEEESDDPEVESRHSEEWLQRANTAVAKMRCHTQFGEGVIDRVLKSSVSVRLDNGEKIVAARSTVFVKNKPIKDIRKALAEITKIKLQVGANIPAPYETIKRQRAQEAAEEAGEEYDENEEEEIEAETPGLEIWPVVVNGFLGLEYHPVDKDDPNIAVLQSAGFRFNQPFKYAEVANAQRLLKQFQLWHDKGFTLDRSIGNVSAQFEDMYNLLKSRKIQNSVAYIKYAQKNELRNFMRMQIKPSNAQKLLRPYPLIENGIAYIALPVKGQSATRKAIMYRAPGIIWHDAPDVLQCFTLTVPKAVQVLEGLKRSGVQITNSAELKKELLRIRKQPTRTDDSSVADI